jgi:pimeloyl-ACP methyl ester carboxylesterase
MLSRGIVEAPNKTSLPSMVKSEEKRTRYDATWSQAWLQPGSPPAASIAIAIVEPRDYQLEYKIEVRTRKDGGKYFAPQIKWDAAVTSAAGEVAPTIAPKGTILILHGYRDSKECMMHWALYLAQKGYRCVLADFRGHGRSTGDWIGFGAFEVSDLRQVLDALAEKKLLTGKLGVIGVSYGGSVGLKLASQDTRVATVVALEPFSEAQKAVEEFARVFAGKYVKDWTEKDYAKVLSKASKKANFSWADTDVITAVEHLKVPVFLVHGEKDRWISPEHSRILSKHTTVPGRLLMLPNDDHLLLSMRLEPLATEVAAWFDAKLK